MKHSKQPQRFYQFTGWLLACSFGLISNPYLVMAAEINFSDAFSQETTDWTPVSGTWTQEDGYYKQKESGVNYTISANSLFNQNSANTETTTNQDNFRFINTVAANSWTNYRVTAKVKISEASSALIYIRSTPDGKKGYAVQLTTNDRGYLWRCDEASTALTDCTKITEFPFPNGTDWHTLIIHASGSRIKIWDNTSDMGYPILEYHLLNYPSGTVGWGSYQGKTEFVNLSVDNLLDIEAAPPLFFAQSTGTTLKISSSLNLNNLKVTVINPHHLAWTVQPTQCTKVNLCQIRFPEDFPEAQTTVTGTYTVLVQTTADTTKLLLEVKPTPQATFAIISDPHYGFSDDFLTPAIDDINQQINFPLPSFVTLTGDLTQNGTRQELIAVRNILDNLLVPYYPIVGNHDTQSEQDNEQGHYWAEIFGSNKFSYTWSVGNFLFLAMDRNASYGGYGELLSSLAHQNWLRQQLATNTDQHVLVLSHYPLLPPRDAGNAQVRRAEVDVPVLRKILESDKNVIAHMAGHSHTNTSNFSDGINYITTSNFFSSNEYRYIILYGDHAEFSIIKDGLYKYDTENLFWQRQTDSTHQYNTYAFGLPSERNFTINYNQDDADVLSGLTLTGETSWQDYTYQAEVNLSRDNAIGENLAGLVFRYQDQNNYYTTLLDTNSDTIRLQKHQDNTITLMAQATAKIDPETTYTIKITAIGPQLKIYLNDTLKIEATDATFTAGKLGLRTYRALSAFDNVVINNSGLNSSPQLIQKLTQKIVTPTKAIISSPAATTSVSPDTLTIKRKNIFVTLWQFLQRTWRH